MTEGAPVSQRCGRGAFVVWRRRAAVGLACRASAAISARMKLVKLAGVLLVSVVVAACGGGAEHAACEGEHCAEHSSGGEHHAMGEGEHHGEHAAMPAELDALHEVLAPVWHTAPGETRTAAACNEAATFRERSNAVRAAAAPAGVDAAAWNQGTATLVAHAEALVASCAGANGDRDAKFSLYHDAFHALVDQLHAE